MHIAAAIIWLGGAVMIQFFAALVRRTGDPLRLVALTRDVEWVGKRVFTPAALAVVIVGFVLVGFVLVWDGPWDLGMTWIWLSLVLFGISFLAGIAFFTPESIRIGKQIEAEGADFAGRAGADHAGSHPVSPRPRAALRDRPPHGHEAGRLTQ